MPHPWPASRKSFLAGGAAALATAGAALAQTPPANQHLSVGTSAIDAAMGLVSAQRAGFFRKHGIDVDFVVNSGAANAAAVAGGTLQLTGANVVTLIKAHLSGVPFQIVVPGDLYTTENPTQVLCVRDPAIKTAADLNGKTIAVTAIGDLLSTSTLAWIDQNGGTSSTVKLVEFPPSAQAAALEAERVAGAALAEPYLSEAVGAGTARVFAKIFDAIAKKYQIAAYFGMPDYINANPDAARRFAAALLEGNNFANTHPDQTLPWLIDFAKVDPAVAKRVRREKFTDTMDPSLIQVEIDALAKLKMIDHSFDARDMIAPSVLNLRA